MSLLRRLFLHVPTTCQLSRALLFSYHLFKHVSRSSFVSSCLILRIAFVHHLPSTPQAVCDLHFLPYFYFSLLNIRKSNNLSIILFFLLPTSMINDLRSTIDGSITPFSSRNLYFSFLLSPLFQNLISFDKSLQLIYPFDTMITSNRHLFQNV